MERVVILENEHIALVVPEKEDLDIMYRGINDLKASSYVSLDGPRAVYSRATEEKWMTEELAKPGHWLLIFDKASRSVVGWVDLHSLEPANRNAELGIMLYKSELLSKGIGTRAIRLMLQYAFIFQGLHKITLWVRGDNTRAIRCYEKCGFIEVARLKEHCWVTDHYEDRVGMEILASEYKEISTSWE